MKFWFKARLEKEDEEKQCSKCKEWIYPPRYVFVEFDLFQGGMPNPQELHPEPTGYFMCSKCGKTLV